MTIDEVFLTDRELINRWRKKIALKTLANWRYSKNPKGPAYTRIGGRILYALEDIKKYEANNKKERI
jgi:hypothetical protein